MGKKTKTKRSFNVPFGFVPEFTLTRDVRLQRILAKWLELRARNLELTEKVMNSSQQHGHIH